MSSNETNQVSASTLKTRTVEAAGLGTPGSASYLAPDGCEMVGGDAGDSSRVSGAESVSEAPEVSPAAEADKGKRRRGRPRKPEQAAVQEAPAVALAVVVGDICNALRPLTPAQRDGVLAATKVLLDLDVVSAPRMIS